MQAELIVQNLKCGGCANTISKHLSAINGLEAIEIEAESSSVKFSYPEEKTLKEVEDKLKHLGYPVVGDTNSYFDKAKSYISCATGKMNQ